jgi:hypothetical protein
MMITFVKMDGCYPSPSLIQTPVEFDQAGKHKKVGM